MRASGHPGSAHNATPLELSTARLRLMPLRIEDAAELFEVRGDPEVMAHWDWPADESPEQTCAVAASFADDIASSRAMIWTVRLRIDESFAGLCDLSELDGSATADLGFMFARKVWGCGYARETIEALLAAAPTLNIRHVHARVHADNARSCRLLERLGFVRARVVEDMQIRPGVRKTCLMFQRELTTPS